MHVLKGLREVGLVGVVRRMFLVLERGCIEAYAISVSSAARTRDSRGNMRRCATERQRQRLSVVLCSQHQLYVAGNCTIFCHYTQIQDAVNKENFVCTIECMQIVFLTKCRLLSDSNEFKLSLLYDKATTSTT